MRGWGGSGNDNVSLITCQLLTDSCIISPGLSSFLPFNMVICFSHHKISQFLFPSISYRVLVFSTTSS